MKSLGYFSSTIDDGDRFSSIWCIWLLWVELGFVLTSLGWRSGALTVGECRLRGGQACSHIAPGLDTINISILRHPTHPSIHSRILSHLYGAGGGDTRGCAGQ